MLSCMGVLWTPQDGALVRHLILHRRAVFSVVHMVSLLKVYATTGLNLRKFMNTKGCRISVPQQQPITAVMVLAIDIIMKMLQI